MRQLIGPILFMLSAGLFFEQEKKNTVIVGLAGTLAVVATLFTLDQLATLLKPVLEGADSSKDHITTALMTIVGSFVAAAVGAKVGGSLNTFTINKSNTPTTDEPNAAAVGAKGGWLNTSPTDTSNTPITDKPYIPARLRNIINIRRTSPGERGPRKRGTVKLFNSTKGYGFIRPSTGEEDVFVRISAVERAGLSTLNEGQVVEYELATIRGKTSAENLKVLR